MPRTPTTTTRRRSAATTTRRSAGTSTRGSAAATTRQRRGRRASPDGRVNAASGPQGARVTTKTDRGTHREFEEHRWEIEIPDHQQRKDSPEYVKSRQLMNKTAKGVKSFFLGNSPYQDHHGGGLWLKDEQGWFMIKNLAGLEWSSQFCADPKKVDELRRNAQRIYAAFPDAAKELGIEQLLNTPIKNADDVARWTDSICNASVPLPAVRHTGIIEKQHDGGVHHYPTPVTDIDLFKYDDFNLWVIDPAEKAPVAVTPVDRRGSGEGRVQVVYTTPGTKLHQLHKKVQQDNASLVLKPDDPIAKRAFAKQPRVIPPKPAATRTRGKIKNT